MNINSKPHSSPHNAFNELDDSMVIQFPRMTPEAILERRKLIEQLRGSIKMVQEANRDSFMAAFRRKSSEATGDRESSYGGDK